MNKVLILLVIILSSCSTNSKLYFSGLRDTFLENTKSNKLYKTRPAIEKDSDEPYWLFKPNKDCIVGIGVGTSKRLAFKNAMKNASEQAIMLSVGSNIEYYNNTRIIDRNGNINKMNVTNIKSSISGKFEVPGLSISNALDTYCRRVSITFIDNEYGSRDKYESYILYSFDKNDIKNLRNEIRR